MGKKTKQRKRYRIEIMSPQEIRNTGHFIDLGVHLANPFFEMPYVRSISRILSLEESMWQDLRNWKQYIVTQSDTEAIKVKSFLDFKNYWQTIRSSGHCFQVEVGAKAVLPLLRSFSLDNKLNELNDRLNAIGKRSRAATKKIEREILEGLLAKYLPLQQSATQPEWLLYSVLPVVDLPVLSSHYEIISETMDQLTFYRAEGAPPPVIEEQCLQLQMNIDDLHKTLKRELADDYSIIQQHVPGVVTGDQCLTDFTLVQKLCFAFGLKITEEVQDERLG
jgi:hypothetical protein